MLPDQPKSPHKLSLRRVMFMTNYSFLNSLTEHKKKFSQQRATEPPMAKGVSWKVELLEVFNKTSSKVNGAMDLIRSELLYFAQLH